MTADEALQVSSMTNVLCQRIEQQAQRIKALEEFVLSLAEKGLNCDFSPTLNYGDGSGSDAARAWQQYLCGLHDGLKERALGVLEKH